MIDIKSLPIGKTETLTATPDVRVTVTRISDAEARVRHIDAVRGTIAMQSRVDIFTGRSTPEQIDESFWSITIDGVPATVADINKLAGSSIAIEADPATRECRVTTKR